MRKRSRLDAPNTLTGDHSTSGWRPGAKKKARKSGDQPTVPGSWLRETSPPSLKEASDQDRRARQDTVMSKQLRLLGRRVKSDSMKTSEMVIVDREVVGCSRATARGERLSCRGRREQKILGEQISSRSPPKIAINGEIRRPCD